MRQSAFLATLESFKGIVESPAGSNHTPLGEEYGWNGVAWCAIAVSVACNRNGFPLHTAAVIQIERYAKSGWNGMGWSTTPVVGAATVFDWEGRGNPADMHTGVVKEVLPDGRFRDLEGNYHDRYDEVLRDMKYVRGFATFPFEPEAAQPAPQPEQPPAPQPAPPPPPPPNPFGEWPHMEKPLVRRSRERKAVVAYLQRVIDAKEGLSFGPYGFDGVFGPVTEGNVRTVQLRHLGQKEVDGIVGPKTWGVIDRLATS
jgi:hypothetical protein